MNRLLTTFIHILIMGVYLTVAIVFAIATALFCVHHIVLAESALMVIFLITLGTMPMVVIIVTLEKLIGWIQTH